jgi:hypothetical protein
LSIILTFVANAGLNFLLGLAVAAVLGPRNMAASPLAS